VGASTTGTTKYLHYDALNSVDIITNNLGVVEARMAYKPFQGNLFLRKSVLLILEKN
jgi:hypothetical protein